MYGGLLHYTGTRMSREYVELGGWVASGADHQLLKQRRL
jgi:hypothetical protein